MRDLVARPEWTLHPIEVRQTERGLLTYECTACRVWTITSNQIVREEWLFIRRESDAQYSFSFSNAPADTSLQQLAQSPSERYFVERTFQDAKSEASWDELVARKYSAWMHNPLWTLWPCGSSLRPNSSRLKKQRGQLASNGGT